MAHRKKTATFRVLHTNPKRKRGTGVSPLLPRWRVGLVLQFFCDEPYLLRMRLPKALENYAQ